MVEVEGNPHHQGPLVLVVEERPANQLTLRHRQLTLAIAQD